MTRTASPGARTWPASQSAVASTLPGATTAIAGSPARHGLRQTGGGRDGRVRVTAGPDVRDRDGVGLGEHLGEVAPAARRSGGT